MRGRNLELNFRLTLRTPNQLKAFDKLRAMIRGLDENVIPYPTDKPDLRYTSREVRKFGKKNHPLVCVRTTDEKLWIWRAMERTEVTVRSRLDVNRGIEKDLETSLQVLKRRWPLKRS